jgi:hypothetical protein
VRRFVRIIIKRINAREVFGFFEVLSSSASIESPKDLTYYWTGIEDKNGIRDHTGI